MLEVCAEAAATAGVAHLVDLRVGDLADPPVRERVTLVTCPFRAYLHLHTDDERLRALRAARELLLPGGRLAFDVFAPGADDIADTHDRWLAREPGIEEKAFWDPERRRLTLSVRGVSGATTMELAWLSPEEWQLADRARRLRGRGPLRLVRRQALPRRRGLHVGRPSSGVSSHP